MGNEAGAFVPNPRYASLPGVPLFQADIVAAAAAAAAPRKGGGGKGGGSGGVPTGGPTASGGRRDGGASAAAGAGGGAGASDPSAAPPSARTLLVPASTGPPHPASSAVAPAMYEFVGKLMGISVRTKACLDFDLHPVVWKALAGEPLTLADVRALDVRLGDWLARVRDFKPPPFDAAAATAELAGVAGGTASAAALADAAARAAEAAFAAEFRPLVFCVCDPALPPLAAPENSPNAPAAAAVRQLTHLPLCPDGASLPVTYRTRGRYVALLATAVMEQYASAVRAMRRGLVAIIPDRAVRLCGGAELQRLVCGEADIDLEVLRANTEYDSRKYYSAEHRNIRFFWEAMATFTAEQKRGFVRFAWGRSKLPRGRWPLNGKGQQVKFKIVPKPNFAGLPLAHTCFFLIELPEYPSLETMRARLLTAITWGANEGFLIA